MRELREMHLQTHIVMQPRIMLKNVWFVTHQSPVITHQ